MAQTPVSPGTYTTLSLEATQMSLINQQKGGHVCHTEQDGESILRVRYYAKSVQQLFDIIVDTHRALLIRSVSTGLHTANSPQHV